MSKPKVTFVPIKRHFTRINKLPTCVGCFLRYKSEEGDLLCYFQYRDNGHIVDGMDTSFPNRPSPRCPVHTPTKKEL